eukprot:1322796-Rhodomonas_salina.1
MKNSTYPEYSLGWALMQNMYGWAVESGMFPATTTTPIDPTTAAPTTAAPTTGAPTTAAPTTAAPTTAAPTTAAPTTAAPTTTTTTPAPIEIKSCLHGKVCDAMGVVQGVCPLDRFCVEGVAYQCDAGLIPVNRAVNVFGYAKSAVSCVCPPGRFMDVENDLCHACPAGFTCEGLEKW